MNQKQTSPPSPSQKSTLLPSQWQGYRRPGCWIGVVGMLGLDGLQRFAALDVGDMDCYSVERLYVDDDATFDRVPYGLFR